MAMRLHAAALMRVHAQLDDCAFFILIETLYDLAREADVPYYLERQLLRAGRDDDVLVARLARRCGHVH